MGTVGCLPSEISRRCRAVGSGRRDFDQGRGSIGILLEHVAVDRSLGPRATNVLHQTGVARFPGPVGSVDHGHLALAEVQCRVLAKGIDAADGGDRVDAKLSGGGCPQDGSRCQRRVGSIQLLGCLGQAVIRQRLHLLFVRHAAVLDHRESGHAQPAWAAIQPLFQSRRRSGPILVRHRSLPL